MQRPSGTLAAINVTKSFGAEIVLDGVMVSVPPQARIGVVGPNGAGKTTLLRVLAGLDAPDSGRIERRPPSLTVGYLPQEADARPDETLRDYLARRTGVAAAEGELHSLSARLGDEPAVAEAYADALDRLVVLAGDDLDARMRGAAVEVGLGAARLDRPLGALSGGQLARAKLAALLVARHDVLLLDEPTNDLDFEGLALLERFVDESTSAFAVVSHDRAFLERAVARVVEFEAETRRVREFAGSWAEYERLRELARRRETEEYARYASERDRFTALLRDRQTQARAGGAMADRRGTHALMSKARAAARRLERLERVEKPWRPWRLQLELPSRRAGDVVARLSGAVVERGSFRLGPLDLELRDGDRLAVVGPNGSGKTTLIGALLGDLALAAGTRYVGPGVRFGELEQQRSQFAGGETLLESFGERTRLPAAEARTLLAKFALGAEDVLRPASSLSPGERTRAGLALLAAQGVNALVLDEPTNHLDLEAIEQLETALEGYEGTIVLVTHDRRLLEGFSPTRTIDVGGLNRVSPC